MTKSQSSPSPVGSRLPRRCAAGGAGRPGATRSASRSRPPPDAGIVAVAEAGKRLQEQQQVWADLRAGFLVVAGSPGAPRGWRGEPPGNGDHSKARARAERPHAAPAGPPGSGEGSGDVHRSAASRRSSGPAAGGSAAAPGAIASATARRVAKLRRRWSPGARLQVGARASTRPASDQSRAQRRPGSRRRGSSGDRRRRRRRRGRSRARRARGGLAGREDEEQRAVADDVGLDDEADAGDHHHVGESEREPELLGLRARGRSRRRGVAEVVEIAPSAPSGVTMNSVPTTAKLAARSRRFRTTKRSARSPSWRRRSYPARHRGYPA